MSFFDSILNGIKGAFAGPTYRVSLAIESRQILFNTYKGSRNVPFMQLLNKHTEFGKLSFWVKNEGGRLVVPLENLEQVKMELSSLSSMDKIVPVEVSIPMVIQKLRFLKMPEDFIIRYIWNDSEKAILQVLEGCKAYFGKGWFLSEDGYWDINGLNETDELWLNETKVRGKDILELVSNVIPEWKKRGIPVKCDITLITEPAFTVKINNIGDNTVECEVIWMVKAENIREIPSLDGYVKADHTLCEGINPATLSPKLPSQSGVFYFKGDDIPAFAKDILPRIRKWTYGNIEEFLHNNHIMESAGELVLSVERKEQNSVGYAEVIPVFVCERDRIKAEDISNKIQPQIKYIRMESGWYPVEKLKQLGLGPMGRLMDGTSLNNHIKLSPAEILRKGSERLDGPWKRIEFPEIKLPANEPPFNVVYKHLEFLVQWGIPGGIIGTFTEYENTLLALLSKLLQASPKARILMVGKKAVFDNIPVNWIDKLSGKYEGNKKDPELKSNASGLFVATPNALETYPGLSQAKWDIVLVLEPDALVKSSTSRIFNNLASCKARVVLGLFTGIEFFSHRQSFEALSAIFGIQDGEIVWKYGLRNPKESTIALPQPYKLKYRPVINKNVQGNPTEFTVKSDLLNKNMPIPPRTEKKVDVSDDGNSGIVISISVTDTHRQGSYYGGGDSFVEEAKKYVGHVEYGAKFIPFMSYWPTYSSMSPQQQKWYFYWRSQVRKGVYPDTDLSYIFVHVYELINNVGVRDTMEGYWQLYNVWTNYRERFQKLDYYLVDWITDYVAIHRCPVDLLQIYMHLVNRNSYAFYPDILLTSYNKVGLSRLTLALIDQLADYSVLRSKFYNEGHQSLLEEYIPKTLERVNACLIEKHHLGILDFFKPGQTEKIQREPFRSALHGYGNTRQITIETIPYSKHKPLRDFFTSIVKYTENKLREFKGYTGRLRGYTLEPEIRAWVEDYLTSEIKGIQPSVKSSLKIEIDALKVAQLIKDSDKVRDMLIVNGNDTDTSVKLKHIESEATSVEFEKPKGTPEHMLTDLEPVHLMLGVLDRLQLQLVKVFAEHLWEVEEKELAGLFPDIFIDPVVDSINDVSLKFIGDILIASENDKKVVIDDFRDELEYLLPRMKEPELNKPAEENMDTAGKILGLPEEWVRFMGNITVCQLQTLEALVNQEDLVSRINRLAEDNFMMPEMLIDSINEAALEHIGDMIIGLESFLPVINEEYLEMVKKITA